MHKSQSESRKWVLELSRRLAAKERRSGTQQQERRNPKPGRKKSISLSGAAAEMKTKGQLICNSTRRIQPAERPNLK